MATNTVMIHTRIEPKLKKQAEKIFAQLGITASEAIRMFYAAVIREKGIPYESRIPNKETRKALDAFLKGDRTGYKTYNSVDDLFRDLND
jgi:DNA-damage-inducible protein J